MKKIFLILGSVAIITVLMIVFFKQRKVYNSKANIAEVTLKEQKNETVENVEEVVTYSVEQPQKQVKTDTNKENLNLQCRIFTEYEIPKPTDFNFRTQNSNPNYDVLSSLDNIKNFNTTYSKSVALGIYATDLIYATTYDNKNLIVKYFKTVKLLANDLGVAETMNDYDSLFIATTSSDTLLLALNNIIQNICIQLDESKAYNQLPFIIYGSWIESVYMLSNSLITNNDMPEAYYKQLANQMEVVTNMGKFLDDIVLDVDDFEINNRIEGISEDLKLLKDLFASNYKSTDYVLAGEQIKNIFSEVMFVRNSATDEPQQKFMMQQKRRDENATR